MVVKVKKTVFKNSLLAYMATKQNPKPKGFNSCKLWLVYENFSIISWIILVRFL